MPARAYRISDFPELNGVEPAEAQRALDEAVRTMMNEQFAALRSGRGVLWLAAVAGVLALLYWGAGELFHPADRGLLIAVPFVAFLFLLYGWKRHNRRVLPAYIGGALRLQRRQATPDELACAAEHELLVRGLAGLPELKGLEPVRALEVVTEADRLAADEQDLTLYEWATAPRHVLAFAGLLIVACMAGFAAYVGINFLIGELNLPRRMGGFVAISIAVAGYHLFIKAYRHLLPERRSAYIARVLQRHGAHPTSE